MPEITTERLIEVVDYLRSGRIGTLTLGDIAALKTALHERDYYKELYHKTQVEIKILRGEGFQGFLFPMD